MRFKLPPEPLLTPDRAAEKLGCTREQLLQWVEAGRIPCYWIAREWRFKSDELVLGPAPAPVEPEIDDVPPEPEVDPLTRRIAEGEITEGGGPLVYFVQVGDDGPIKIGRVAGLGRVRDRLRTLQGGCPYPLIVRRLVHGDPWLETTLHEQFAETRIRGEWFEASPELLALVALTGSYRFHTAVAPGAEAA